MTHALTVPVEHRAVVCLRTLSVPMDLATHISAGVVMPFRLHDYTTLVISHSGSGQGPQLCHLLLITKAYTG